MSEDVEKSDNVQISHYSTKVCKVKLAYQAMTWRLHLGTLETSTH